MVQRCLAQMESAGSSPGRWEEQVYGDKTEFSLMIK